MDTAQILTDLRAQRDRITAAIAALEALNGTAAAPAKTAPKPATGNRDQPSKKRVISLGGTPAYGGSAAEAVGEKEAGCEGCGEEGGGCGSSGEEISQGCSSRLSRRKGSTEAHERGHEKEAGGGGKSTVGGEEGGLRRLLQEGGARLRSPRRR